MANKSDKFINVGNLVIKVLWLVFFVTSLSNINRQINVLIRAKNENLNLEKEILSIEQDNIKLEQNIRYATSSAYLEQVARDLFGLGTSEDYWIVVPSLESIDMVQTVESQQKSNWKQWLELFTY